MPWVFVAIAAATLWGLPLLAQQLSDALGSDPGAADMPRAAQALGDQLYAIMMPWRPGKWPDDSVVLNLRRAALWAAGLYGMLATGSFVLLGPLHAAMLGLTGAGRWARSTTYGSARWGVAKDAVTAGCLRKHGEHEGLILGRVKKMRALARTYEDFFVARYHVLTVAPNRTGKGVSCVIPAALTYPGSMFIFDPKGEVCAVTAKHRKMMGGRVARLDPFGVCGQPSHAISWLSAINVQNRSCVADAASLANALVARGHGDDSHWDDQAQYLLQGLILYVASFTDGTQHMGTVREMLTSGQMDTHCAAMAETNGLGHGVVARVARAFMGQEPREKSSTLSTAQRHTAFLDDPCIVDTLCRNDFDFSELKYGKKPVTVYLILPPDKLKAYARFVRATLNIALSAMVKSTQAPKQPVVFLLDEFAQLGRCAEVEDKLPIIAGYGVWFWLFLQDLSQLKKNYGTTGTFLDNAYLQVFSVQGYETAKAVSDAIGAGTVQVTSSSRSTSATSRSNTSGQSESVAHAARMLATPDEVMRLDRGHAIVFANGLAAFKLQRLDYRNDPELAKKAEDNPFYRAA